ncbi:conserved hypothetical protein [Frankia canadensis]|uniref:Uncharacterized protein n=1 Tax=Frankia canadensis TaxID=1836972 RepID=A0A2I2KUS8_9ACTN|nr:hypothetical protein [Frankia canadensis]SNQ49414.1 conserved hypothetical protein [Frankia canadensis]SOU56704.1 conserved hypothetical protein [Frankia canadensis]
MSDLESAPRPQQRVTTALEKILDAEFDVEVCPPWLLRPGRAECAAAWTPLTTIYRALTGQELPETAPPRERRRLDIIARYPDGSQQTIEIDERQHFTAARAATFPHYPADIALGYDPHRWLRRSQELTGREPGGGFARPCPPLFPGPGGRHRQRAFRDALADLVPPQHGWLPTVRIADFQIPTTSQDDELTAATVRGLLQRPGGPPTRFLR